MVEQMYDVIVCGAGPVGLFFTYQMVSLGHSVYLLDQKEGPTDQSRAFFVTSRSLQIFENKGISHRILHEAYILRGVQLFIEGSERTSLDADVSGSPFPQLTSLPQSKTESILSSIIQDEKNTKIHWKEILISYSEEDDHVIASLSTENGPKSIRGRYIIGADGSHSTVRKCDLSWKYEGYSAETKFALADVSLSGPGVDKLKNKYNIFYHSDGMCLVIPIKYEHDDNNLFRIIANMGPYDKREMKNQDIVTHGICKAENDTLSLEQVNEVITTRTENLGLVAKNPKWITHFHINERKANGYRRGRAFLMGDAAHCHSPVGGQGMNLGLQDADNMAWKMSLVLKGKSSDPEMLLNSYSIESELIAENIITQTGNATELMMSVGFVMAILRYFLSTSAFGTEKLKEYSMMSMLQLNTAIDKKSPLLGTSDFSLIESGKFLPETLPLLKRLLIPGPERLLERSTLYQIVGNTSKHILLWVATRPVSHSACNLTSVFWEKINGKTDIIRPIIVESIWHVPEYRLPDEIEKRILDTQQSMVKESENFWIEYHHPSSKETLSNLVGIGPETQRNTDRPPAALILVRPDLYISLSTLIRTESDIDRALSFLKTYIR